MPIFAPKKEEVTEIPEKIPKVPTAEELKEIAAKLREWLASTKSGGEIEKLKKISGKLEKKSEVFPIVEELKKIVEKVEEAPKPEEVKKEVPPEKVVGPPLFIKLEKYHKILRHIGDLRRILSLIKSITLTLAEVEKVREDNVKLLRKSIERIDTTLGELDKELLRPRELPVEYPEVSGVGSIVNDLKEQIQSLKDELESVA